MSFEIGHAVGRFVDSGSFDFRDPNMTNTPNACVIFANGVNAPTFVFGLKANAQYSIGFGCKKAGVISQGVCGVYSQDAQATTNNNSYYDEDNIVFLPLGGLPSTNAYVEDFLPNNGNGPGVRLFFIAGADATFDIMLIHSDNEEVDIGLLTSPGAAGGTVVATTDFEPSAMMFISAPYATPNVSTDILALSYGVATADLTQRCQAITEDDGLADGSPVFQERNDRVMVALNVITGAVVSAMELTAVSSTGFTLTQRTSGLGFDLIYIAFRASTATTAIVDVTSRTSTGTQTVTAGFRPQAFIMPVSMAEAFNTAYTNASAGHFGVNLAVNEETVLGDGREVNSYYTGISIQDGATTTNTFSMTSNLADPTRSITAYDDAGNRVTGASYSVTTTGFIFNYQIAPSSALQWWMLVFGADIPNVNPPARRMYSLLHGLALSIVAKPSPLSSVSGFHRDNLAFRLNSYDHEIGADGGYLNATITMSLSRDDAYEWLEGGVAKEIAVYNEGQQLSWLGLVNSVNASLGSVSLNSGNLLDVVNRIRVTYQTARYDVIDYGGQERITEMTEDTNSQQFFGVLADIINGGTASDDEAAQLQAMFLAELAYLSPTQSINLLGGDADTKVTLDCIGYYELLDKALADEQAPAELTGREIIEDVVGGAFNGLFDVLTDVESNDINVGLDTDHGRAKVSSIVKSTVAMGDVANNRWTAGSMLNRRFYYRPRPTSAGLVLHLSDSGFLLKDNLGAIVHPWDAVPGKWAVIPDLSLSRGFPSTLAELDDDRRSIFVERVRYSAPYGLELTGGRLSTINQRLAKQGLGGI